MKKIITILGLMIASMSIAFANNFYLGVGGGYDTTQFDKTLNITDTNTGATIYDKHDYQAGTGYIGNVFAGYTWNYKRAFLSAELNGDYDSLRYHGYYNDIGNADSSNATYTMRQNYGFSLLPGFWLTDQVGLYARIGVARSNFSYSEYKDSAGVQTGMSDNQWLNGMRFGVGLTAPLSPNWQMRLDYSFLKYKTYVDTSFPMPAGQSRTIRLTPDSSQIELDFLYQFS